jgi:hypothetical protein
MQYIKVLSKDINSLNNRAEMVFVKYHLLSSQFRFWLVINPKGIIIWLTIQNRMIYVKS